MMNPLQKNLGLKSLFIIGIIVCIIGSSFFTNSLIQILQQISWKEIFSDPVALLVYFLPIGSPLVVLTLDVIKTAALFRGKERDRTMSVLIPINLLIICILLTIMWFTVTFSGMGNRGME